jgi:hypothetical protein
MAAEPNWDDLIAAAAAFQEVVPGAVLVGGTAAALHAGHRLSTDTDHTIGDLRSRFEELLRFLEQRPGWRTARVTPPTVILGNFHGVETTLRQLRRSRPLETVSKRIGDKTVVLPSVAEMIRVKGWLALTRNTFRDYLDVAALTAHAGQARTQAALGSFDACYRDVDHKAVDRGTSPLLQLARQLADPRPGDLSKIGEVSRYKGIVERWNSWEKIATQCKSVALWTGALLATAPAPP